MIHSKRSLKVALSAVAFCLVLTGCTTIGAGTTKKHDSESASIADSAFPLALEAAGTKEVVSPDEWASTEVCGKVITSFDDFYANSLKVIDFQGWLGRSIPPLQETFIPTLWITSEPEELGAQGTTMLRARVEASMQNLILFTEPTPTTVPCGGSKND